MTQKDYKQMSENLTEASLAINSQLLDEITYTIRFAQTAVALGDGRVSIELQPLRGRYDTNPNLFESDLRAAPSIVERLETWARELPEESQTRAFASAHLLVVKHFYRDLLKYKTEIIIKADMARRGMV